ncbi:MAG: hypothetical protein MUC50_17860 [Myxococcota bacterium]|jgi:hypothetical protein|nr:hypothetical protein [Myxococcota bacterium]
MEASPAIAALKVHRHFLHSHEQGEDIHWPEASRESRLMRCGSRLYLDADLRGGDARLFTGLVPSQRNTGVYVSTVVPGSIDETAVVRLTLHDGCVLSEASKILFVKETCTGLDSESGLGFLFVDASKPSWNLLLRDMGNFSAGLFEPTDVPSLVLSSADPVAPLPETHAFHGGPMAVCTVRQAPENRCEAVVAEAFAGARDDPQFEWGFASDCRCRLFVATTLSRPVDARLDLWLVDAAKQSGVARLRGTVRWVRKARSGQKDAGYLPGMGVELDPPSGVDGWQGCLVCAEYF